MIERSSTCSFYKSIIIDIILTTTRIIFIPIHFITCCI